MESKIIFLAGPIDYWWNENWNTPQHIAYKQWRDNLSALLVMAGHLVYRPHEAFKGAWNERAQAVNREALIQADIVIDMRIAGIPAYGTAEELAFVREFDSSGETIQIRKAPPDDLSDVLDLIKPLDDPYSVVFRKSYTRWDEPSSPADLPGYKWEDEIEDD